jgi:hypothetical protein
MLLILILSTFLVVTPMDKSSEGASGKLNEVVSMKVHNLREFYVYTVKETQTTDSAKRVDVEFICKNMNPWPELCIITSNFSLRDTSRKEYRPNEDSIMPSIRIPPGDIAKIVLSYKIPREAVPHQLVFMNVYGDSFNIDLMQGKVPEDLPPLSEWVGGANKGLAVSNGNIVLRVHEERIRSGTYQLDISLENVGVETFNYNIFDMRIKDPYGFVYEHDVFSVIEPGLYFGDLKPGEMVRGWVSFDVSTSVDNKNFMLIYDSRSDTYLVSGHQRTQQPVKNTEDQAKMEGQIPVYEIKNRDSSGIVPAQLTTIDSNDGIMYARVGSHLGIGVELVNNSESKVQASYVVLVKTSDGLPVYLEWIDDLLVRPDEPSRPKLLWIAGAEGQYQLQVFLWTNLDEPAPLSSPLTISVTVV